MVLNLPYTTEQYDQKTVAEASIPIKEGTKDIKP